MEELEVEVVEEVEAEAVEAEAAKAAAAAAVAAVAAAAAAQLAEKGLARVEERVRHLEDSLDRPANGEARVNKTNSPSPRAAGSDCGRRPKRGTKFSPCSLSRSPSRSSSRVRDRSSSPFPPAAADFPSNPESANRIVLDAVEEGNVVARRAGEVAQEALMLGKEAAERSERAGEFRQAGGVALQRVRYQCCNLCVFGRSRCLPKSRCCTLRQDFGIVSKFSASAPVDSDSSVYT